LSHGFGFGKRGDGENGIKLDIETMKSARKKRFVKSDEIFRKLESIKLEATKS
jgi:hypothetical protein